MSLWQRLRSWKVWAFLGVSVVLAAAVFMFQVGTVSPGTPDVCEEPCDEETEAMAAELPGGPLPGPLLEPFAPIGGEPVTGPDGPPTGSVEAPAPATSGAGVEIPASVDSPAAAAVEGESAAEAEGGVSPGDEVIVPGQAQEVEPEPPAATVERPAAVNKPASGEVGETAIAEIPAGEVAEMLPESIAEAAAQLEAESKAARRETTAVQAAEPPESVDTEVEQASEPGTTAMTGPAEPRLLPARRRVPAPRGGISVARGALGYRVPLVVKQRMPDQIRGGVYVLAHETYVVLQPGHWEPEGAGEDPAAAAAVSETMEAPEAAKGGWLRRLFGKRGRGCDGGS